jgi:hypothetical protein
MADGEHSAVHDVQSAGGDPAIDRTIVNPGDPKLRSRHHPVLVRRQRGDRPVGGAFAPHIEA